VWGGEGAWGAWSAQDARAGAGGNPPLKSTASPRGTSETKPSRRPRRRLAGLCPTQPTNPKSHRLTARALCSQANQEKGWHGLTHGFPGQRGSPAPLRHCPKAGGTLPGPASASTIHSNNLPSRPALGVGGPFAARPFWVGRRRWRLLFVVGWKAVAACGEGCRWSRSPTVTGCVTCSGAVGPARPPQPSWAHLRKVGMSRTGTLRVSALTRRFRSSVSKTTSLSKRMGSSATRARAA